MIQHTSKKALHKAVYANLNTAFTSVKELEARCVPTIDVTIKQIAREYDINPKRPIGQLFDVVREDLDHRVSLIHIRHEVFRFRARMTTWTDAELYAVERLAEELKTIQDDIAFAVAQRIDWLKKEAEANDPNPC